jgi:hypothetical protein
MTIIISTNTVITSNVSYNEQVQIAPGATLTILPGASINLNGNTMLVAGSLNLAGDAANFAKLLNGTISTESTSGKVVATNANFTGVTVDDFFSYASIQVTSSIFDSSVVKPLPSSTFTSVLFQNTSIDVSGANGGHFVKSTFLNSPLSIGAWNDAFYRDSTSISESNFIGENNVITLDPFFSGSSFTHKISISSSYIAGASGTAIEGKVLDANDDIRIATDIRPDSFTSSPYLNDAEGFRVGNVLVTRAQLGIRTNVVTGTAGDDSLNCSDGNDAVDGGKGTDVAVFSGRIADYALSRTDDACTVQHLTGGGAIDTLINVERLKFDDRNIAVDLDGTAGQAYRLYQAAFDRKPDLAGLGYWINDLDHGASLEAVAVGFFQSPEFKNLYGVDPNTTTLLTNFYQNVLHRAPDQEGFAYWQNQLEKGEITPAGTLASFCESAENKANVIGSIQNGIEYAAWMG